MVGSDLRQRLATIQNFVVTVPENILWHELGTPNPELFDASTVVTQPHQREIRWLDTVSPLIEHWVVEHADRWGFDVSPGSVTLDSREVNGRQHYMARCRVIDRRGAEGANPAVELADKVARDHKHYMDHQQALQNEQEAIKGVVDESIAEWGKLADRVDELEHSEWMIRWLPWVALLGFVVVDTLA